MSLFASDHPDDAVGDGPVPGSGWTPPPARTPRTERLDLDDWGADDAMPTGGNRRWLLVAAVVPWVVVVAIMVTGGRDPDASAETPAPATEAVPSTPATPDAAPLTTTSPAPSSTPGDAAAPVTAVGSAAGPDGRGEAVGLALVAARTWLSTRPAGQAIEGLTPSPGAADRYVEHLAVEAVDHPARGGLVVTVRAIVLPVEGDAYGPARTVRVAVPVVLDATGARLGGAPWPLPPPRMVLDAPDPAPVDDPDLMLAAVDAVRAVGYRDVELVTLGRTSGWAWIAEVVATAPDEDAARTHTVWLRSDVGRLVVAGTRAPDPAPPPTVDPSSETDEATEVPS